jgi:hypothetical protein
VGLSHVVGTCCCRAAAIIAGASLWQWAEQLRHLQASCSWQLFTAKSDHNVCIGQVQALLCTSSKPEDCCYSSVMGVGLAGLQSCYLAPPQICHKQLPGVWAAGSLLGELLQGVRLNGNSMVEQLVGSNTTSCAGSGNKLGLHNAAHLVNNQRCQQF